MYSLIIQGLEATKLQFRDNSGQEFRSLVESMTLNRSVLICSKYRTDLIYESKDNLQETIVRIWCKVSGIHFTRQVYNCFLNASDEEATFLNYFVSLKGLAFSPAWFEFYKQQFHKVVSQEPYHPIHRRLLGCAWHLSKKKNYKVLKRFLRRPAEAGLIPMINPKMMAEQAQRDYVFN